MSYYYPLLSLLLRFQFAQLNCFCRRRQPTYCYDFQYYIYYSFIEFICAQNMIEAVIMVIGKSITCMVAPPKLSQSSCSHF